MPETTLQRIDAVNDVSPWREQSNALKFQGKRLGWRDGLSQSKSDLAASEPFRFALETSQALSLQ